MIREHERIVLGCNLPAHGLRAGDVGTVIHVHRQGKAYEVEFVALDGQTAAIATAKRSQVRKVRRGEIAHARRLATA
jgi:hypothetical protein